MVHIHRQICLFMYNTLTNVCDEVSMPMAPEKVVGLVQVIEFLSLLLDTLLMVVRILLDKLNNILAIIVLMIRKRKAMVAALESLTGKLNFVS